MEKPNEKQKSKYGKENGKNRKTESQQKIWKLKIKTWKREI